jgi:hypothetical protein
MLSGPLLGQPRAQQPAQLAVVGVVVVVRPRPAPAQPASQRYYRPSRPFARDLVDRLSTGHPEAYTVDQLAHQGCGEQVERIRPATVPLAIAVLGLPATLLDVLPSWGSAPATASEGDAEVGCVHVDRVDATTGDHGRGGVPGLMHQRPERAEPKTGTSSRSVG